MADKSMKEYNLFRNLEELIEHYVPGDDMTHIRDTIMLSKKYIKKLDIKQLLPPVREAPKPFQLDDDDNASDAGKYFSFIPFSSLLEPLAILFNRPPKPEACWSGRC